MGNFLGKEALAAVSSSGPLIGLFIGFFNGAATGAGVVISRYFGAQEADNVRRAIHTSVLFSLLRGLFLSAAGICRGAGKATVPMLVMLGVWCALRICYITLAMRLCHDIRLLFWAYPLTWTISAVIFSVYYRRSNWLGAST